MSLSCFKFAAAGPTAHATFEDQRLGYSDNQFSQENMATFLLENVVLRNFDILCLDLARYPTPQNNQVAKKPLPFLP